MDTGTLATSALMIVTLIVLAFVSYELYQYYESGSSGGGGGGGGGNQQVSVPLIGPYKTGNSVVPQTFSDKKFPRSTDQPTGIEFSYALWMRVRQWTPPRSGNKLDLGEGVVFIKGVPGGQGPACPALTVRTDDPAIENALNIYIDTFNRESPTEKITIHNLPAGEETVAPFFHLAVVVSDKTAKIYVNGLIKKHETLNGIPQQNHSSLVIAPDGPHETFTGEIGSFSYYNYALPSNQVMSLANTPPVEAPSSDTKSLPPYQAPRWWM